MVPFLIILTELSDTVATVTPKIFVKPVAKRSTSTSIPQIVAVAGILNPRFSAVMYSVLTDTSSVRNEPADAYWLLGVAALALLLQVRVPRLLSFAKLLPLLGPVVLHWQSAVSTRNCTKINRTRCKMNFIGLVKLYDQASQI